MQSAYLLVLATLACVLACRGAAGAYMKNWEPREEEAAKWSNEKASNYDQAMLKKLQAYLNADAMGQRYPDPDSPVKRQMLYNQCYFNPISCFRRRK